MAVEVDCRLSNGKYCGLCCIDTEMPLAEEDIARIKSLGYPEEFFVRVEKGVKKLRNVGGKCVFLDALGRCKVYPYRPLGCRLYPLVYDPEKDEVKVDPLCPKKPKWGKVQEELLRRLVEETY